MSIAIILALVLALIIAGTDILKKKNIIKILDDSLTNTEKELDRKRKALRESNHELSKSNSKLDLLKSEMMGKDKAIARMGDEIKRFGQDLADKKIFISELKSKIKEQEQEIEGLKKQNTSLVSKCGGYQTSYNKIKTKYDELLESTQKPCGEHECHCYKNDDDEETTVKEEASLIPNESTSEVEKVMDPAPAEVINEPNEPQPEKQASPDCKQPSPQKLFKRKRRKK